MGEQTVALASDHAGFALKEAVKAHLTEAGVPVLDLGTDSPDSVDYPDFGYALAQAIEAGKAGWGVAICGTGIGISIAVNRHPAMRAALCHDVTTARLARRHNDANVIALGGRIIGTDVARDCVDAFLATSFEGGRHGRRVTKLSAAPEMAQS